MYILGSNLSHDRSACLLKDGRIVAAISEERLDGIKRSTQIWPTRKQDLCNRVPPFRSINYCLNIENIGIDDLDLIIVDHAVEPVNTKSIGEMLPIRDKSKLKSIPHPSHHLAHAYSTYFCSPFPDSAVLVADVFGSQSDIGTEAESGFYAEGTKISPVLKNFQNVWSEKNPLIKTYYGLTYIYNFISLSLGFSSAGKNRMTGHHASDAGKTMGLASYGMPIKGQPDIVELRNNRIETKRFTQWALDHNIAKIRKGVLVPFPKAGKTKINQYHMDLAYTAQCEIEKGMIFLANKLYEITGSKNLCIAGGAGLNSVANQKLLNETPFENIFVQPASTDDGNAIGCAYYGWFELSKQALRSPQRHVYFGKSYGSREISESLQRYDLPEKALARKDLLIQTAQYLADGKIVGWFQGGSEFGPRALGHRSILADPRRAEMKDLINRKIKHRENFRPYASSVILEQASDYFHLSCPSPYMLLVADVKNDKACEIPATVHVDGTSRVQTVTKNENGIYFDLLQAFFRLTGVPVVLNTSFNTQGMPIVESPNDAINMFFDSPMDVLVLDCYIFDKQNKDTMAAIARQLTENGKLGEARALAQRALKLYPADGRFYAILANYHFEKKNYQEAIEMGELAMPHDKCGNFVDLHRILGISYERIGEYSKAVPELKRAEVLNPNDELINFFLFRCYKNADQDELMNRELDKGFDKFRLRQKGF